MNGSGIRIICTISVLAVCCAVTPQDDNTSKEDMRSRREGHTEFHEARGQLAQHIEASEFSRVLGDKDDNKKSSPSREPCKTGKFKSSKTKCRNCSPGFYSANYDLPQCTPCEAGKFTAASGQDQCTDCVPGTYAVAVGQTKCLSARPGFYSEFAEAYPSVCPSGKICKHFCNWFT